MTDDLERRLSTLLHERAETVSDRVDVPDGLGRLVARRRAARRVAAGGTALLIGVGVVGGVAMLLRDGGSEAPMISAGPGTTVPPVSTTSTAPTGAPTASGSWSALPEAPIAARGRAAFAWSGEELIVWGGVSGADFTPLDDGAAYDPDTQSWRTIAAAPISGREAPASVWAGDRMFVWGGVSNRDPESYEATLASDGALYDPLSDTWEAVPEAPIATDYGPWAVWTGREVVVSDAAGDRFNAALYDPATLTWRVIEGPAEDPGGWSEPILVGGELFWWEGYDGFGFALDPENGEWRALAQAPPSEVGGEFRNFDPLFWTGTEVLGRGTYGASAYDPATDSYRELPTVLCGYGDALVWTGTRLLTWGGSVTEADEYDNEGVAIDPTSGEFEDLPPVGLEGRQYPAYAWTGQDLIVWGGVGASSAEGTFFADGAAFRPGE